MKIAFNRKTDIYLEKRECYCYPDKKYAFSPSIQYPEYPWDDIAEEQNETYDMVRALLFAMGLDTAGFGTRKWNPLGEIINPGDKVVLKPNLVIHRHYSDKSLGIESIITHPSIVRAIADYCLIALEGQGELIVADAPVQTCDFDAMIQSSGYSELITFYQKRGIRVKLKDFRLTKTQDMRKAGSTDSRYDTISTNIDSDYITVDIGKNSSLMDRIGQYNLFRVTNYNPKVMKSHHNTDKNEYLIPKAILNADVIINLPKPKTHRKAGMTAAMKNLVGINGHKDWLPHHTRGAAVEGGDEYLYKSRLKQCLTSTVEKADINAISGKHRLAFFWSVIGCGLSLLTKLTRKDEYFEGSWYGNDTIWRTVCDLNRIIFYCDKHGVLRQERQRKCLQIGDMIVSGEGEGPMCPTPKNVGIIAGAFNPLSFDTAICALMGLDWAKIPNIYGAYSISSFPIAEASRESVRIRSNAPEWNGIDPGELTRSKSLQYNPSKGWLGHIEI